MKTRVVLRMVALLAAFAVVAPIPASVAAPGDGLTVYSGEWWHFDGPGAGVPRPILDVPVT